MAEWNAWMENQKDKITFLKNRKKAKKRSKMYGGSWMAGWLIEWMENQKSHFLKILKKPRHGQRCMVGDG